MNLPPGWFYPESCPMDEESFGPYYVGDEEQVEVEVESPNSPVDEPDSTGVEMKTEKEEQVNDEEKDVAKEDDVVMSEDGCAEKVTEKVAKDEAEISSPRDNRDKGEADKPQLDDDENKENIPPSTQKAAAADDDENKENIPPSAQKAADDDDEDMENIPPSTKKAVDDEDKESIPPKSQVIESVPMTTPDANNTSPVVLLSYPSTPHPKRMRSRFNCECVVINAEYKRNRTTLVEDIEREGGIDLQHKRRRLCDPERLLCTEFQISKGIIVRLVVLSDCEPSPAKRVVLTITSQTNEIRVPATSFLKAINSLNREFMKFDEDSEEECEIDLCDGTVFAEIMKDEEGLWMVFRQYIDDWVAERIYMSPKTWFEFRALCPLLSNCLDVYLSKLMLQTPISALSFIF